MLQSAFRLGLQALVLALVVTAGAQARAECDAPSTAEAAKDNMKKREALGLFGAIVGEYAGRRLGRETGVYLPGALLGQQLGLELAGPVAEGLDDCDKKWVQATAEQSLETGQEKTWRGSASGATGTNQVVPTDPEILARNPGKTCRTIEQTVTRADGTKTSQRVAACKGDDGVWEAVK